VPAGTASGAQHNDGNVAGSSAERRWHHNVVQTVTYLIPPQENRGRVPNKGPALTVDLIKE